MAIKLYKNTVSQKLYHLLGSLMTIEELRDFYLVGGTSLALQIGHRTSVDIDLFSHKPFDVFQMQGALSNSFKKENLNIINISKNTITAIIDEIKVDIICHEYPLLETISIVENIRFMSLKDIAALKLNAIGIRGSKKDFWDMAYLLEIFSVSQILNFYETKYNMDVFPYEKSLLYFEDANLDEIQDIDLKDINKRTWTSTKDIIKKKYSEYLKSNKT